MIGVPHPFAFKRVFCAPDVVAEGAVFDFDSFLPASPLGKPFTAPNCHLTPDFDHSM